MALPALALPMMMMGGGAISKALGGLFGGKAKQTGQQDAARDYMRYMEGERNKFINDPNSAGIRSRLGTMATGNVGFSDPALKAMRGGLQEDYGKSLKDVGEQTRSASVMPGGGYAPGRAARTSRLLGENLAVRKAEGNRAITTANEQQANSNMRYAISALPTYTPGFSQTPQLDPGTFLNLHAPDMGPSTAMGSIGNALMDMPMMMQMFGGGFGGMGGGGGQSAPNLPQLFGYAQR